MRRGWGGSGCNRIIAHLTILVSSHVGEKKINKLLLVKILLVVNILGVMWSVRLTSHMLDFKTYQSITTFITPVHAWGIDQVL